MKSIATVAFALLTSTAALAQEDERVKRIVDRIEMEIRESHDRTREEIRAIIRSEIQKSGPTAKPQPPVAQPRKVYLGITAEDLGPRLPDPGSGRPPRYLSRVRPETLRSSTGHLL